MTFDTTHVLPMMVALVTLHATRYLLAAGAAWLFFWTWRGNRDKGFPNHDLREDTYHTLEHATADDLLRFQQAHVKGRHYTWLVLGDRQHVDFKYLKKIGKVTELTLDEVFRV